MRTELFKIANSTHKGRTPVLGRLWPRVTAVGEALTPQLKGVNSCVDEDLLVVDSLLRSRLELVQDLSRSSDHLPYFCIYMADRATWLERPTGRTQQIEPYELAIISSEAPLRTVSTTGTRHLSVFMARSSMLARMPWADEACGQSLDLDAASRLTARGLVATLRASLDLERFDAVGPGLVRAVLGLLSAVGAESGPPRLTLVASSRQEQVADCIRRQFADPALTVAAIADELKVSARYLQRVCEGGDSPGEQLRRFRLRKAAERLRNSVWKNCSITEICFSCGFSSSSHFSTEFRRFYGVTPRDYRV